MKPMIEAPRDGTEILAYHKEGGNFHPIKWSTWQVLESKYSYWGMRWHQDYKQHDQDFEGWIDYPTKEEL